MRFGAVEIGLASFQLIEASPVASADRYVALEVCVASTTFQTVPRSPAAASAPDAAASGTESAARARASVRIEVMRRTFGDPRPRDIGGSPKGVRAAGSPRAAGCARRSAGG